MNKPDNTQVVSTRIPSGLAKEMKHVAKSSYLNEADFVRSAIRNEVLRNKINEIRTEFKKDKNSVNAVRKLRRLTSQLSDIEYDALVEEGARDMPLK